MSFREIINVLRIEKYKTNSVKHCWLHKKQWNVAELPYFSIDNARVIYTKTV